MELAYTKRFVKALSKLDQTTIEAVEKALILFIDNPRHPGLNMEKRAGSDIRTIRANRGCRIILRATGRDAYEVIDVGPHDINRFYD